MIKRDAEPFLWMLFSAGGVVSAMLMPALAVPLGVAFPLGWLTPPTRDHMATLLANPLVAIVLARPDRAVAVPLGARFRHTLYDGFADQASAGGDRGVCLRRRDHRLRGGRLSPLAGHVGRVLSDPPRGRV